MQPISTKNFEGILSDNRKGNLKYSKREVDESIKNNIEWAHLRKQTSEKCLIKELNK